MKVQTPLTRHLKYPEALVLERDGRILLLSVGTSSVFEIDPLTRDVLKALSTNKSDKEVITALSGLYDRAHVLEALEEVKALKNAGCFNPSVFPDSPPYDTYELVLTAFHGCTLRCRYCYADGGRSYTGRTRSMTFDIAQRAIDYMINDYARDANRFVVNFTSGGEPLLNFELFKQVEQYCPEWENRDGRQLSIRCGFVTNGTLLTDEITDYLRENDREISFSMDGPPEVHDAMRCFPDGRGSYGEIVPRLQRYRVRSGKCLRAAVALTARHTDFSDIVTHLVHLGFRKISMKPVRVDRSKPYGLNWATLDAFKEGYDRLGEFLVTETLEGHSVFLEALTNHSDFLIRLLVRLLLHSRIIYRCRAPGALLVVTAEGDIYPCQDFLGRPELRIGDVFKGVNKDKQRLLMDLRVDRKPGCRECWARYLCGGGCYAAALLANGDVSRPDEVKCDLIKHLIRLSMQMIVELQEKRPEILPHLCRVFAGEVLPSDETSLTNDGEV